MKSRERGPARLVHESDVRSPIKSMRCRSGPMALKTLCVFGTRPEAIKMAPLALALAADPRFEARVCVTAQHREMLDQVMALFDIGRDLDLDVMTPGQDLARGHRRDPAGHARRVRPSSVPTCVLVQGDTATTLAASLAGYLPPDPRGPRRGRPAHGRPLFALARGGEPAADRRAGRLHFAPTGRRATTCWPRASRRRAVHVTGNTVIDALLAWSRASRTTPICARTWTRASPSSIPAADGAGHRPPPRELRRRIRAHLRGAGATARRHPDVEFVYPGASQPERARAGEPAARGHAQRASDRAARLSAVRLADEPRASHR